MWSWQDHQSITSPYPDNPDGFRVNTVDKAKRGMYQLPDCFYGKLGDDATTFRKISQLLSSGKQFAHQTLPHFRNLLFCIPGKNILKITQCRFGELNRFQHHTRPSRDFASARLTVRPSSISAKPCITAFMNDRSSALAS